jgi:hypothetical protein
METCSALSNVRQRTIDAALHKIQEASQAITPRKTISNAPSGKFSSWSSKYLFHDGMSRRSDTSSLVKRKRAKAEALKASVAFAEKQAALLKQEAQMEATAARRKAEMELKKAEITADLKLLESRSVAAVAQTEARILEEDGSQTGAASQDQRSQLSEEEADPFQRVQDYVEEQSLSLTNQDAIANHDNAHFDVHMDNIIGWNTRVINPHPMVTNTPSVVYGPPEVTSTPFSTRHPASKTRPVTFQLSENAPDFVPSHQRLPYEVSTPNLITESVNDPATVNQTSEITRFLLHKEILLSGLTNFNDRAESYYVWKNSFKSVIDEAKISDSQ